MYAIYIKHECSNCMCLRCRRRIDEDCTSCSAITNKKFIMCENYMGECSGFAESTEQPNIF